MNLTDWLLEGDASVAYQVHRDLLNTEEEKLLSLQESIANEGWCQRLLSLFDEQTNMWGGGVYGPKWISTTYTMLDLKNFAIDPKHEVYKTTMDFLIDQLWVERDPKKAYMLDLCICGMLINLACYGESEHPAINAIIDGILDNLMPDGAWNCRMEQAPHHSSVHTTINILEGLAEYIEHGYTYRIDELKSAIDQAHEFLLSHRLFKSDKTGEIIHKQFTMLSYPSRWKYDLLRALDYFRKIDYSYDDRMDDAIALLRKKRRNDGYWPVQQKYSGLVHFDYEKTGGASRINTLRVLRVFKHFNLPIDEK